MRGPQGSQRYCFRMLLFAEASIRKTHSAVPAVPAFPTSAPSHCRSRLAQKEISFQVSAALAARFTSACVIRLLSSR